VNISETIEILQVAVGPVILISGVGLLLLTMTNRLARVVDRTRHLSDRLHGDHVADRERSLAQLRILHHRARTLRRAIEMAATSVLLAAVLVIVLFFTALFRSETGLLIVGALFVGCMVSLIGALGAFLIDVHHTMEAVELDLEDLDLGEARDSARASD
jgi:hypothetical protein